MTSSRLRSSTLTYCVLPHSGGRHSCLVSQEKHCLPRLRPPDVRLGQQLQPLLPVDGSRLRSTATRSRHPERKGMNFLDVAANDAYASSLRVSHRIDWSLRQRALSVKLETSSVPNAPTMTPTIAGSWIRKFLICKGWCTLPSFSATVVMRGPAAMRTLEHRLLHSSARHAVIPACHVTPTITDHRLAHSSLTIWAKTAPREA